jgi:hypothetical protein
MFVLITFPEIWVQLKGKLGKTTFLDLKSKLMMAKSSKMTSASQVPTHKDRSHSFHQITLINFVYTCLLCTGEVIFR